MKLAARARCFTIGGERCVCAGLAPFTAEEIKLSLSIGEAWLFNINKKIR